MEDTGWGEFHTPAVAVEVADIEAVLVLEGGVAVEVGEVAAAAAVAAVGVVAASAAAVH